VRTCPWGCRRATLARRTRSLTSHPEKTCTATVRRLGRCRVTWTLAEAVGRASRRRWWGCSGAAGGVPRCSERLLGSKVRRRSGLMRPRGTGCHRLRYPGAWEVSEAVSSFGCSPRQVRTAAPGRVVLPGGPRWQASVAPASVAVKGAVKQGSGRLQLPLAFRGEGAGGRAYLSQTMSFRRRQ
jgi:hypothetical protein